MPGGGLDGGSKDFSAFTGSLPDFRRWTGGTKV
jgi:hypothetical protein